jgi:hypothetical protein
VSDQTPSIEEIRARRAAYDRGTVSVYEILRDMDSLLSRVEADERRIKDLEAAECTTGCCAVCGKPAKIIRGNVNDIVCTTIMRECRCNGSFNLWPTARPLATSTPSTEERAE